MADINPSIGKQLKTARLEQNLTLEEISLSTRIRERYLAAIEGDNWDVLPSTVQQKGFVRSFARAVDLDPAPLLQELRLILQEEEPTTEEALKGDPPAPDNSPDGEPVMEEIGEVLKSQREKLGFTITNIEEQIFIPERYLEAIEGGSLEKLPSTVQGKGMVKNYAEFLGMDPEPLLMSYADMLQSRLKVSQEGLPEVRSRSPIMIWFRRFLSNPTLLWAGVMILIASISIWAGVLIFGGNGSSPAETATIPAVADMLMPSSTFSPTPEAPAVTPGDIEVDISPTGEIFVDGESNPAITPTPGLSGNEKVQVQLIILQRAWVRVIVDNILAFEGRLLPGSVKFFGGELSIEVVTGNAAGVEVIYNQRDLGVMGLYGEVVDRVFTAEGIATPTPTITLTPTPSITPEPSLTPTATLPEEGE
jgi:cytoskeletal protein RodZ